MPPVHGSDRSARLSLPRQAKLPKTPPRPPHHRLTRATAPTTPTTGTASNAASRLRTPRTPKTPVSSNQLTASDDDEPLRLSKVSASAQKRKPSSTYNAPSSIKRPCLRRTSAAKISSYAEPDSDTDLGDNDDVNDSDDLDQDLNGHVSKAARGQPSHRSKLSHARKQLKTPRTTTPVKEKKTEKPSNKKKDFSYPGNVLPYHVWCRIFEYIASPLLEPEARPEDVALAMRKLMQIGSLGKLVYEPAMVALYRCPYIFDQATFRLLSRTLSQRPSNTLINYRPKVETLRIDSTIVFSLKYGGSYSLLDDMVPYLPRLMDLELYVFQDNAPYRSLDTAVRCKYPDNLLQVLEPKPDAIADLGDKTAPTELRSWRWNARLAGGVFPLNKLKEIHSNPSFASLRKVTFINYQLPSSMGKSASAQTLVEQDATAIEDLATAIRALPRLEHLVFESSTMVVSNLLELLPKTLKHIELINCWEVTSDDLADFLRTHGNSLECLTLKHCIALSMGFTSVLEKACPNLTHLHLNLLYYRTHEHYNDAQPLYDNLLEDDEVPKWPASIQSIEISYMRFENLKTAETLLRGLIASAPKLPNLRRLVLGAKMNVSFRERTAFRHTWVEKTYEVFKRRDDPPLSIYNRNTKVPDQRDRNSKAPKAPARRSTRLVDSPPSSSPDNLTVAQENNARASALARQLQWSMRDLPATKYRDADDEGSEDELAAGSPRKPHLSKRQGTSQPEDELAGFVQGLCDVVEIEVDNQKPTENKFSMDDFLDSPPEDESDADWNGDETEEEDPIID